MSKGPVRSPRPFLIPALPALLLFIVSVPILAQTKPAAKASTGVATRGSRLEQTDRELQLALKKNPDDVHALTSLGVVRQQEGKYVDAEKLFIKAAQVDPKAVTPIENLARLYFEEHRNDEAIPIYEALEASRKDFKFRSELAVLYQRVGNYQKSLDIAEMIPSTSRTNDLLISLVADYIGLKQSERLQEAVDAVIRRAPADPDLVPQLANVFLDGGMVPDATELLRMAGKHQRVTANYLAAVAKSKAMSGNPQEAKGTLAKALQLDPKSRDALTFAARLAGNEGDWKLAVMYLQRAQKSGPPTPELLNNLVFACMRNNDLQAAHNAALDLLDIQPNSPDAGLVMCAVLIRAAHWGEADPMLDKILAVRPNDKKALLAKGVVDYNMGRIDDAHKHLTASMSEGSGDAEANYYLGLISKQRGDLPAAANYLESSLKAAPDNVDAMTALGQIYLAMGEAEKAKGVLERATVAVPKDPQTHYQLALAYKKLGLNDKAQEQMATFQQLSVREGAKQPVGHVMNSPK